MSRNFLELAEPLAELGLLSNLCLTRLSSTCTYMYKVLKGTALPERLGAKVLRKVVLANYWRVKRWPHFFRCPAKAVALKALVEELSCFNVPELPDLSRDFTGLERLSTGAWDFDCERLSPSIRSLCWAPGIVSKFDRIHRELTEGRPARFRMRDEQDQDQEEEEEEEDFEVEEANVRRGFIDMPEMQYLLRHSVYTAAATNAHALAELSGLRSVQIGCKRSIWTIFNHDQESEVRDLLPLVDDEDDLDLADDDDDDDEDEEDQENQENREPPRGNFLAQEDEEEEEDEDEEDEDESEEDARLARLIAPWFVDVSAVLSHLPSSIVELCLKRIVFSSSSSSSSSQTFDQLDPLDHLLELRTLVLAPSSQCQGVGGGKRFWAHLQVLSISFKDLEAKRTLPELALCRSLKDVELESVDSPRLDACVGTMTHLALRDIDLEECAASWMGRCQALLAFTLTTRDVPKLGWLRNMLRAMPFLTMLDLQGNREGPHWILAEATSSLTLSHLVLRHFPFKLGRFAPCPSLRTLELLHRCISLGNIMQAAPNLERVFVAGKERVVLDDGTVL